ncbi:hypothetical protein UB40_00555 [Photobacterium kishitanii]|nr:hypothetical protein UB40_00555 [Photobacterium kishitanii]
MEAPIGPPATLTCELGQARKGATAAGVVCAGMWLVGASTHLAFRKPYFLSNCYLLIYSLQCSLILLFYRVYFIFINNSFVIINIMILIIYLMRIKVLLVWLGNVFK